MEQMPAPKNEQLIAEGGMKPSELAKELEKINSPEEGGRNLPVIKNLSALLLRGDIDAARAFATHDSDKIWGNSEDVGRLRNLIKNELFRGEEDHPWSLLEELSISEEDAE
jgi:hypothetical protein